MPARSSDEKGVRPSVPLSVHPSVKRVHCVKTEESSFQIFIPYKRLFSLIFWKKEEWLVAASPSTWNFASTGPVGAKFPILHQYSLVVPQP